MRIRILALAFVPVNYPPKILFAIFAASAASFGVRSLPAAKTSAKEARVTQIIREVKLLPSEAEARAAEINDRVPEDTAVRTGEQSRSELTFADLTITRLGANSIYNYDKSGRVVDLRGGSILLRVPKDSGGANINAQVVSVAVTGTTLILETSRGGRSKLIVLEGTSRLTLLKNSAQKRNVQAGQMLDVPAGASVLPEPVEIDLNQLMKTHPLIAGFPPLPSQDLIAAVANRQGGGPNERVYPGQPVGSGPRITTGGFGLPGLPFPTGGFSGGSGGNVRNPGGGRGGSGGHAATSDNQNNPNNKATSGASPAGTRQVTKASRIPKRTPTPTPVR